MDFNGKKAVFSGCIITIIVALSIIQTDCYIKRYNHAVRISSVVPEKHKEDPIRSVLHRDMQQEDHRLRK